MGDLSEHFSSEEFRCRHCGVIPEVEENFLAYLEDARLLAGIPFIITSGYRCPAHNKEVGGVEDSEHTLLPLRCCDIQAITSEARWRILSGLMGAGFKRIGISFDDGFLHADMSLVKASPVLWGY